MTEQCTATRIVVVEESEQIWVDLYDDRGHIATVTLSASRALAIAEDLIAAARRRIEGGEPAARSGMSGRGSTLNIDAVGAVQRGGG